MTNGTHNGGTGASDMQPAHYDLTLARLRPRTVPAALERMQAWLKSEQGSGELLACLFSELGIVNQVLLLRRFDGIDALLAARQRIVHSTDPLGIGELALELVMNIGVAMPAASSASAASSGPFFEVRTDVPRPGSMARAFSLWRDVHNRASGPRPCFGAYSIAGDSPSLVHIWPWSTLDERAMVVDDASPTNIWRMAEPDDAPLSQRVDIFRAASFSPMQ
jgi:hypothetical protein